MQQEASSQGADRDVYTVSRLNQEVKFLLEDTFPLIWVEGELSNFSRPRSGHWYFTLKDEAAQVRCAMFRGRNANVRMEPREGEQVLIRARIGLYVPRGEYQLVAEHMEPAGAGALQRAFEQLKARLEKEGLFDGAHKKPLPRMPKRIGVVTSPTGAAIRDVLTVFRRRFPSLRVLIYPVPVQGENAAPEIAAMIRTADQRREVDALLVTRGGGSMEDLWAFNEEVVARAIYDCGLPVVAAVGHEVDFTIAEFVADQRAPTPSAAAELLSPDGAAWLEGFRQQEQRLLRLMSQGLERRRERMTYLRHRLEQRHPGRRLQELAQRVDELERRLHGALSAALGRRRETWRHLDQRLRAADPSGRIRLLREKRADLTRRLERAMTQALRQRREALAATSRALEAVSPLATLNRGYAVVRTEDGEVVRDAERLLPGTRVLARVQHGELLCRVEDIDPDPSFGRVGSDSEQP
ncbi:exodeoxyribonuclease VII large subunit [Ectothiorhodospiraceae bacterium WFHF3C12]|nr:exodeoxyribonuclease VII large subunit [Ectothiorhodospiraceae bacterium WFHF3C12]